MTKLGKLKKKHNQSLTELSILTGLSRSFISQACSGKRNIGAHSYLLFLIAFQNFDPSLKLSDLASG